jgi:transcriptional regulator with XRE-family HTH domain
MTPTQFREARQSLGLTQSDIAPMIGLGAASRVSEIENGATVPKQAALLIEALLSGWRPAKQ